MIALLAAALLTGSDEWASAVEVEHYGLASHSVRDRDVVYLTVRESWQGQDLDGDGEITDSARLYVLYMESGELVPTPLERGRFSKDPTDPRTRLSYLTWSEEFEGAVHPSYYEIATGEVEVSDVLWTPFAASDPPTLPNYEPFFNDDVLLYSVRETGTAAHGEPDLNGDGDLQDTLVYLKRRGEEPRMLGTGVHVALRDDMALVELLEGGHVDLNGDGTHFDRVPALVDARTGAMRVVPLSLAGGVSGPVFGLPPSTLPADALDGDWTWFEVSESKQGQTDLNGDGDTLDDVVHLLFPRTGSAINAGFTGRVLRDGDAVGFEVFENDQGADLNGDGVLEGSSLYLRNRDGSTSRMHIRWSPGGLFEEWEGSISFLETAPSGRVALYVYDTARKTLRATEFVRERWCFPGPGFQLDTQGSGRFLAFLEYEECRGMDLNGDGDKADTVLHSFDAGVDRTTNHRVGTSGLSTFQLEGSLLLATVDEAAQGGLDLNDDGRVAHALYVADLETGDGGIIPFTPEPLGQYWIEGRSIVTTVSEGTLEQDLNGDGDLEDGILFRISVP